ncbi:tetraspanin-8 [Maylandia zebra]|uniref:Tetraspanin n=2 Tax=Haplochromini TaxID=319058 RepID=A0A3B4FUD4_9CICH|nr:tetraspanin-8 [Maylandia zebra]XP_005742332.1 PREDICTED: tetraspanin-8-like [Pundamilia nyererei]
MAQINTCLKRTFIIFNIFFAIVGGVIISLALLAQFSTSIQEGGNLEGRDSGLFSLYIMGAIIMVLAILGAYGAHKESRVALIVFLVCMVLGCLVMFKYAVPVAIMRPQIEGIMENKFRMFLPLDENSRDMKNMADNIQKIFHCCGLFSYKDWNNIPESCKCNLEEEEEGKCQTVGYRSLMERSTSIYTQTCFPIIMHYFLLGFDIVLGVFFTLAILALLGTILSSAMIHQMRYPNRPPILLTVPTVLSTSPPKYEELYNPPPY